MVKSTVVDSKTGQSKDSRYAFYSHLFSFTKLGNRCLQGLFNDTHLTCNWDGFDRCDMTMNPSNLINFTYKLQGSHEFWNVFEERTR